MKHKRNIWLINEYIFFRNSLNTTPWTAFTHGNWIRNSLFFLLKASNSFSPLSSLPIHLSLEATLCVLSHPYPSFSNESPFSLLKSPVPPPFPRAGEQGIFSGSRRNAMFASTRQGRWYRRFWTWILVRRLDGEWANLGFVSRERWEMRYN